MKFLLLSKDRKLSKQRVYQLYKLAQLSVIFLAIAGIPLNAIAKPDSTVATPEVMTSAAVPQEVDSSLSRTYEPATIYLPDPNTQQLMPQVVSVAVDDPVEGAVGQILDSYSGQDMGITGYEVTVNEPDHTAQIDFDVTHERGADAFQSLSSTNQVALFEAIRETLLTQPLYSIDEIIFSANGQNFDI